MTFDHSLYVGGHCLVSQVSVADNFFARAQGLLLGSPLRVNQALLIPGCSSVHTFFMRYAIDLIFIDAQNSAIEVRKNVVPWCCAINWKARAVLELPAGSEAARRLRLGDNLCFIKEEQYATDARR